MRRDRAAEARDIDAGALDREAEARAAQDLRLATKDMARAVAGRAAAADRRTRATGDRETAAAQRAQAAADRVRAAAERSLAATDARHSGATAEATEHQSKARAAAAARDSAAARRDEEATARDSAAEDLDRDAEVRALTDSKSASVQLARATAGRSAADESRALAHGGRQIAARDRAQAESDRLDAARDRALSSEALDYRAHHDALTGLPNRTLLVELLDRELMAATRDKRLCGLLVLDVDQFKYINDSIGHDAGDQLMVDFAARIKESLAAGDTLAHLSGDEFAVLPAAAHDMEAIRAAAAAVIAALEAPFTLGGITIKASVSIGIGIFPDHARDASTLMRRADIAMYDAKQSHSGYAVYSMAQEEILGRRMTLLGELREAIAGNEIVLHYQPQVDMAARQTVGVEALVRWTHPRYGLVPPDEFIPAAEASDLIGPLTRWILNEALRQTHVWERQGIILNVSVNISASNLLDPGLPSLVGDMLQVWQIPSTRLTLEITETTVISTGVDETLKRLRALGIGLSIDDFGTGYASLTYLRRLPVTELKLDRSFVGSMATNSADAVIVKPAISLGHNLGLTVVAEGVEDEATWAMLAEFDCDRAQGYYLARPMPPDELVTWLAEDHWGHPEALEPASTIAGSAAYAGLRVRAET